MDIIKEAMRPIVPDKIGKYRTKVKYSGKFSEYNANVKLAGDELEFSLSKSWRHVSNEIKIGLLQTLLLKLFRPKSGEKKDYKTTNIDLYNMFLKNLHVSVSKNNVDMELAKRFEMINEEYFNGMLDMPNLTWGPKTFRKLGSYEYGNDTILLSEILKGARQELIDYVLYHEMLHKKLKYNQTGSRSHYHTPEFRKLEKNFPNAEQLEKELSRLASRKKFFDFF